MQLVDGTPGEFQLFILAKTEKGTAKQGTQDTESLVQSQDLVAASC